MITGFTQRGGHLVFDAPGGTALFTTRADVVDPVDAATLASAIGIPVDRWAQDEQVHGSAVRRISDGSSLDPMSGQFDGQATTLQGVAVVVRTADCLPVALVSTDAVGMVHAGWRGLVGGVLEEGVRAMRELGDAQIRAAIGPGAGACCYEVGEEVHGQLERFGAAVRRGAHADLKAAARLALEAQGVTEIADCRRCTICAPQGELWSHRRDGAVERNGSLAWRS
jgi:YfiH family protein